MGAVIFNILSILSPAQCALLATVMWCNWKRRNLKLWQHITETNAEVMNKAITLLEDWRSAQII